MQMNESLELQLAESQLQRFERDPVMRDHDDAQDCWNCERHLGQGIEALKWLTRCEEAFILADAEGLLDMTATIKEAIKVLYQRWLTGCFHAEAWITNVERNSYALSNATEFRDCGSFVRDWLERNESYELSYHVANERFAQEEH